MVKPYCLVMIKPMTVGRGEAPSVLSMILDNCPVVLRKFRTFNICDTTLDGLVETTNDIPSTLDFTGELIHTRKFIDSWICLFVHQDGITDPTQSIEDYVGPLNHREWRSEHLRYKFGGFTKMGRAAHPSDTVVHVAHPERSDYEANVLFTDFDKTLI